MCVESESELLETMSQKKNKQKQTKNEDQVVMDIQRNVNINSCL